MEFQITTKHILKVLYFLSWIIFVGLCIEVGSYVFNGFYTFLWHPDVSDYLQLNALYRFDKGQYIAELILISIPGIMKAMIFYLFIRILHNKKLDLAAPFNQSLQHLILLTSCLALGIGLFSNAGANYTEWLASKDVPMPDVNALNFSGGDVWLFMSVILFVIAQIFKRGMEIQSENELTI